MTDGEDLTKWQRKRVGLTTSAELVNLERDIPYAIRVAARTKVLYGSCRKFVKLSRNFFFLFNSNLMPGSLHILVTWF
jgi:hypothetical protein